MKAARRGKRTIDSSTEFRQQQMPGWLRKPLANWFLDRINLADDQSERELLRRLATDRRMERVWAELYKKKGRLDFSGEKTIRPDPRPYFNKAFIWPETRVAGEKEDDIQPRVKLALKYAEQFGYLDDLEPGSSEQDDAAVLFIERVFICGLNIQPKTYSELQQDIRDYESLAREERRKASLLSPSKAKDALELAQIYELHAEYYSSPEVLGDPTVISRVRGDARERTLLLNLLMITNSIFRKDLLNTVGTVGGVILNLEKISRDRLRGIVRFCI